jgi:hypothetical protein
VAIALVQCRGADAQTFRTSGSTLTICGVPKFPQNVTALTENGCTDIQTSPLTFGSENLQMIMMAQIADLKDQLVALNTSVTQLMQSNVDAANANKAAAQAIHDENTTFNKEFTDAITDKLNNYPADFINSPAYQQLKQELTKMINDKLNAAPAANPQPVPHASASDAPQTPPRPTGSKDESPVATSQGSATPSSNGNPPALVVASAANEKILSKIERSNSTALAK